MMPPSSQPGKLRASCDSCNEARVRCSQTHPICERCLKNNINCIYGISRRAGRNRASTRNRSGSEQTSQQPQLAGHNHHTSSRPPSRSATTLLQQQQQQQQQEHPSHGLVLGGFPIDTMPLLDDFSFGMPGQHLREPSISSDLLADMFATSCPPFPSTRNEHDMGSSAFSLGDTTMVDAAGCNCISSVFSFFSTHPMLTGTHPAPIDACLVQGRESINVCERILSCVSSSRHHYRPLITVALFIDRIVAIYDRAKQHYHQTLLAPQYPYTGASASASISTSTSTASVPPPPPAGPSTGGSSSPSQAWSLPQTPSAWMDLSKEYPFQTRPESSSSGVRSGSAFIGDYQLDKDDDVKMTIEIVFSHLSKVANLIALFKSALTRDDLHLGLPLTDVPTPPQSAGGGELPGYEHQAFVSLRLVELVEQQLNATRGGWESICKEWESYQ